MIEVVASLAILSVLLVSILVANGRLHRQRELAAGKEQAVAAADQLLADWFSRDEPLPLEGEGLCGEQSMLVWKTRAVRVGNLASRVPTAVVLLSIESQSAPGTPLFQCEYLRGINDGMQ